MFLNIEKLFLVFSLNKDLKLTFLFVGDTYFHMISPCFVVFLV